MWSSTKIRFLFTLFSIVLMNCLAQKVHAQQTISNPFIWADIPDISIIRVGETYYMSSTTMHMNPGVPIMESKDLVNWKTINYAYQTIANNDKTNLNNDQNAYSQGSWAASLRHKDGVFYVLVPGKSSGKTHLYSTTDIYSKQWNEIQLPFYHDPSLFFDDDGKNYIVYGGGDIRIVELNAGLTGLQPGGVNKILITDATSASGSSGGLPAEGAHIEKINNYYYVFTICWPPGNGRTQLVHRSTSLLGSYQGKIALQSKGVAQGSVIEAADGSWYGYLFQDNGSVGRSPWIMPVTWVDNWPIFNNNAAPQSISLNATPQTDGYGIVASDDFSSPQLLLEWQWNHNPVNNDWSLTEREGFLRLTTSRIDNRFLSARNTLTQRSFGPTSSAQTLLNTESMKVGDVAGIGALQAKFGYIAVKKNANGSSIIMVDGSTESEVIAATQNLIQSNVHLRIDMDFTNRTDKARFYYSLDGISWTLMGNTLQMSYTLPHFMGYRYGLFNFSTQNIGGYADFDHFKIGSSYLNPLPYNNIVVEQKPYLDSLIKIPGKWEAEDYDQGGEGYSYHDSDILNQGSAYRNDGVDITGDQQSGYMVGWTTQGEWLEYSIDVEKTSSYMIKCRVSSGADGSAFKIQLDGVDISPTIEVPNGGDWETYTEVQSQSSEISMGQHTLKIMVEGSYFNIDWIEFIDESITNSKKTFPQNWLSTDQFQIFNLRGESLGIYHFNSLPEISDQLNSMGLNPGIYFLKNMQNNHFFKMVH